MATFRFHGEARAQPLRPPNGAHLRAGMFVVDGSGGGVAILTASRHLRDPLNPQWGWATTWELHYLHADGSTLLVVPTAEGQRLDWLRQARLAEIPAARRPSDRVAREFGYA